MGRGNTKRQRKRLQSTAEVEERLRPSRDSSDSDGDGDDDIEAEQTLENAVQALEETRERAKRVKQRKIDRRAARIDAEYRRYDNDASAEESIAFCCFRCRCSEEHKKKYSKEFNVETGEEEQVKTPPIINEDSSEGVAELLWHRRCCHRVTAADVWSQEWMSPYQDALEKMYESLEQESSWNEKAREMIQKYGDIVELDVDLEEVHRKYMAQKDMQAEIHNDRQMPYEMEKCRTAESYGRLEKEFGMKVAKAVNLDDEFKPKAVVLDLFGGIGSALVCLKRLGISISRVVHVEHDKVANQVYNHWHNAGKDNIEHISIHSFDKMEREYAKFVEKHGPFHIVIGGPPCVDYSAANANRRGVEGEQGSYLTRMGRLVRQIQELQKDEDLFFLAENSILRNDKEKALEEGDLQKVMASFRRDDASPDVDDFVGFALDSRDHCSIRRHRSYITNIRLADHTKYFGDEDERHPHPGYCLDDGFALAANIIEPDMSEAKANCFMASKGRIDNDEGGRMHIFREYTSNMEGSSILKFIRRTFTTVERERLMGFPEGYVEEPVHQLFKTLRDKGFALHTKATSWETQLDKSLHKFAGDYHNFKGKFDPYKIEVDPTKRELDEKIRIKMAPPLATKEPQYYSADEYAKRLIGNAFCIPTVEYLLSPLVELFARKEYPGYGYLFRWKDEAKWPALPTARSEKVTARLCWDRENGVTLAARNDEGSPYAAPDTIGAAKLRQEMLRRPKLRREEVEALCDGSREEQDGSLVGDEDPDC